MGRGPKNCLHLFQNYDSHRLCHHCISILVKENTMTLTYYEKVEIFNEGVPQVVLKMKCYCDSLILPFGTRELAVDQRLLDNAGLV